ncbi:DUF3303 domain-containing protein [Photobacterium sanctipauli]|uniref:DUF3303 domain-containing protein n=1 Tax=Photobacterium sanctipauli TaxID=1342794 RepID=A0A2T3P0E3_9GAMM|nr:DUF3303 family protein [Photobacterium sanctipauli]PSW21993.1 DUF3303 domain-containing protein [Photobacterium sanctipauli]
MLFLVSWQLHEGRLHPVLAHFAQMSESLDKDMMGDEVTMVGRWHDLVSGSGVAIVESDSAEAVAAYALAWNSEMDISVQPVVDDAAARRLGSLLLEE